MSLPKLFIGGITVVLVFSAAYFFSPHRSSAPEVANECITEVIVGEREFEVDVADTRESRRQGLSGRESLAENEGLLFTFENPGTYPFWMRDMHFPIDIIWIQEDKTIVGVAENLSPDTFPQTFPPPEPITYVLEVHADFDETQIRRGDRVSFSCVD